MTTENNQQKMEIAKRFVDLHKEPFFQWMPDKLNLSDNERYLVVYSNLMSGIYGDLRGLNTVLDKDDNFISEATEFEIEVGRFESKSGNSEIFSFEIVKNEHHHSSNASDEQLRSLLDNWCHVGTLDNALDSLKSTGCNINSSAHYVYQSDDGVINVIKIGDGFVFVDQDGARYFEKATELPFDDIDYYEDFMAANEADIDGTSESDNHELRL